MELYKLFFKPSSDYFLALLLLFALGPFMLLILIINRMIFSTSIFAQKRIGRGEREFSCYKFRSMKTEDSETSIPGWGRFLRLTSIDELPQLINILRGEMSFIGPRPLLPEYLGHYNEEQLKRHLVKPGITGLAQIKGRNSLPWKESLAFDVYYAENCSFALDVKIVLLTIPQLFKFGQVNQSKNVSRGAFNKEKQ